MSTSYLTRRRRCDDDDDAHAPSPSPLLPPPSVHRQRRRQQHIDTSTSRLPLPPSPISTPSSTPTTPSFTRTRTRPLPTSPIPFSSLDLDPSPPHPILHAHPPPSSLSPSPSPSHGDDDDTTPRRAESTTPQRRDEDHDRRNEEEEEMGDEETTQRRSVQRRHRVRFTLHPPLALSPSLPLTLLPTTTDHRQRQQRNVDATTAGTADGLRAVRRGRSNASTTATMRSRYDANWQRDDDHGATIVSPSTRRPDDAQRALYLTGSGLDVGRQMLTPTRAIPYESCIVRQLPFPLTRRIDLLWTRSRYGGSCSHP